MMKKTVLRGAGAMALSGLIAFGSVFAGDDNDLYAWAKKAAVKVDDAMTYPDMVSRRGSEGLAVFHVTIDRDGEVVKSELVGTPQDRMIRGLARRVVKKADFPALPASFEKDRMKFALELTYTIEGSSFDRKMKEWREGRVTGAPVASNGSDTLVAGITILDDQGE